MVMYHSMLSTAPSREHYTLQCRIVFVGLLLIINFGGIVVDGTVITVGRRDHLFLVRVVLADLDLFFLSRVVASASVLVVLSCFAHVCNVDVIFGLREESPRQLQFVKDGRERERERQDQHRYNLRYILIYSNKYVALDSKNVSALSFASSACRALK